MSRFFLNGIAVDTFHTAKLPAKGTVLFLNGLPGAIGPLPAVVAATQRGWNVLFPQYPGTYDSDGELSVTGSVKALCELLRHFDLNGTKETRLDVERPRICIAHSFGAFQLMGLLRTMPESGIDAVILLAPVVSYSAEPPSGTTEDLLSHLDGVRKSRPRTYRIKNTGEWSSIAAGKFPIESVGLWHGECHCVIGASDDTFDISVARTAIPRIVRDLTGGATTTMEVIDGAEHGMDELIPQSKCVDMVLGGPR